MFAKSKMIVTTLNLNLISWDGLHHSTDQLLQKYVTAVCYRSLLQKSVTEVFHSSLLQKSVTYRGLLRNPPLSQSRLEGRLDQKVDSILFHFRLEFDHISIDQKSQTTKGPSSKSQVNEDWTSYDYSLSAFS